jgi:hypothetical protein
MFRSLKRSFQLAKESFLVLCQDLELLLLTAASFVGVVIVIALAGGMGFGTGAIDLDAEQLINSNGIRLLILAYFVSYFIIIYCQVALVCAVQFRISGGDPNVWHGLRQANRRLGAILSWTLIAATVGLIFRILEGAARGRRGGPALMATIILKILGVAWGLLVFFVIPVIASEGLGGFKALRRSSSIIKSHWGEAIVGTAGMGMAMGLLIFVTSGPLFTVGILNLSKSGEGNILFGAIVIAIAITIAVIFSVFSASLNSTYRAVLFAYANDGTTGGYSKDTLNHAFHSR